MRDEELEALLESTRPRGPSAELRARILARPAAKRVWPWAAAVAALLVLTLLLQVAAAGLRHGLRNGNAVAGLDAEDELTSALRDAGGLPEDEARLLAMVSQMHMRIEQNRPAAERPEP